MSDAAGVETPPPVPGRVEHAGQEHEEHIALDPQHPWPGLVSFTESNQAWFRGRDTDTRELFGMIEKSLVTVVYGPSGLGKTSLLQAGVFPKLREANWLPVPVRFDFYDDVPLIEELFDAVARETGPLPERRPGETYWEFFHRRDVVFWNERHRVVRPVLVFDQFEELFTIGKQQSEGRAEFMAQLADLAAGRPSEEVIRRLSADAEESQRFDPSRHRYAIVLSLREDYLAELDALRALYPGIDAVRKRLTRMNGHDALQVVGAGRDLVEPDTVRAIVNFVADVSPDSSLPLEELEVDPALLSVVCAQLNKKRIAASMAKIDRGLLEQNRKTILADFYAAAMKNFEKNPSVRKLVEDGLLTPNGYRASVSEDQAQAQGIDSATIGELVKQRLVRVEARGRARRIELTHDLLTSVVSASRDVRKEEERRLAEAGRVAAERREAQVRSRLRVTNVALGLVVVLLIAAAAIYLKYRFAQRDALRSSARWALRAAVESVDGDREPEALALLAYAMRNDPKNIIPRRLALDLLLSQLWYVTRARWTYDEDVYVTQLSADGKRLMVGYGQSVAIRSLPDGETIATIQDPQLRSTELSPDGRRVVTTTNEQIVVWDATTGRELVRWQEPAAIGWFVSSPKGSYLAVVAGEHVDVRAIDGTPRFRVPVPNFRWLEMRFSPDETSLAIASHANGADRIVVTTWDMTGRQLAAVNKMVEPEMFVIDLNATRLAMATAEGVRIEPLTESSDGKAPVFSPQTVTTLAFNADGSELLGFDKGRVHVWHLTADKALSEELSDTFGDGLLWASFTGDGLRIVTMSASQLRVWTPSGEPLSAPVPGGAAWVHVSDDARQIAVADEKSVSLLATPGLLQVTVPAVSHIDWLADDTALLVPHGEYVEVIDAVDGRARKDKELHVDWFAAVHGSWIVTRTGDTSDWTILDTNGGARATIGALPAISAADLFRVSGDGTRLVRATKSIGDFEAAIYDTKTGAVIRRIEEFPVADANDTLVNLSIDHDGSNVLFFTETGVIAAFDVANGTPPAFTAPGYKSMDVDHAGEAVVASTGWNVGVLDGGTLQPKGEAFPRSRNVVTAVFSNDDASRYVALASRDGMVRVWQREPQEQVGVPLRHVSEVTLLDFTRDGQRLVTSTADAIRVWDVASGVPLTRSHRASSTGVLFGEPALRLVFIDRAGLAHVLELPDAAAFDAEGLAEVAENVAGLRYEDGQFTPIHEPMNLAVPRNDEVLAPLIGVFQATDANRALTPFTDNTLAEYVKERLEVAGQDREKAAKQLALVYPGLVPAK